MLSMQIKSVSNTKSLPINSTMIEKEKMEKYKVKQIVKSKF